MTETFLPSTLSKPSSPDVPEEWPRWIFLDFGNVNTAACILIQACAKIKTYRGKGWMWGDPIRKWYVVRTYHNGVLEPGPVAPLASETVEATQRCRYHAQQLLGAIYRPSLKRAIGGSLQEDGWREAFQLGGLTVHPPKHNDVEVGIGQVYAMIANGELVILNHCTELLTEIREYSRELGDDGEKTDKIKDKAKFHRLDALRSGCTWIGADREPKELTRKQKQEMHTTKTSGSVYRF